MVLEKVLRCILAAVWLFSITDASDAQQESPLEGPEDCISYVGSNVTFTCVSPLRNCVGMTWYKSIEGTDRETIFSACKATYLRDKYIVEDSDTGCTLIVTNVEVTDTGSFISEIQISHNIVERTARLAVINDIPEESPLKGPGNVTTAVGSSATFTCVSPLRNCAGISWNTFAQPSNPVTINVQDRVPRRQEKYIIEDSTEGCNLTVKNVEVKDEGGFFCRIFIGKTTIESTGYLTVTGIR